jgi:ribosomal protein L7Ae-like RNA K-turn-binding protein
LKRDNVLSLISLAKKAGRIAAGEFQTEQAVRSGAAHLVIVSTEASDNTKKKFTNMCTFHKVPVYFYGEKEALGAAIGCEFRATVAVLDQGFAASVKKKLDAASQEG